MLRLPRAGKRKAGAVTTSEKCGNIEDARPVPLAVVNWVRDRDLARLAELNAELRRCIAVMDCAILELIASRGYIEGRFFKRALSALREQRERARTTSEGTHAEDAGTEKDVR